MGNPQKSSRIENKKAVTWNMRVYTAIRFHQILKGCLWWLKKNISKGYCYRCGNRKMHMWNFLFRLPNVKTLDKNRIFSIKNKQKGKYVEK